MRRPDIELSDAAARYVEEHPGVIEKLAGGIPDAQSAVSPQQVDRFRGYVRDQLAWARTPEAAAEGKAWLAKNGLDGLQLR